MTSGLVEVLVGLAAAAGAALLAVLFNTRSRTKGRAEGEAALKAKVEKADAEAAKRLRDRVAVVRDSVRPPDPSDSRGYRD